MEKQAEKPDHNKKPDHRVDESHLSPNELQRLKEGKTTIDDITEERNQLKAAAEAELKHLVVATKDGANVIDLKEYKDLQQALEETKSAEKTKQLLEEIKDLPNKKAQEKNKKKEEETVLHPEDPKLLELQKEFDKICDDNVEPIGEGQVAGFKAWANEERRKNPTVKNLKTIIGRLEGKQSHDRDGLFPRRIEYARLQTIFKKYGLSSPQESDYIRQEGLKERQHFRQHLEDFETHFQKVKGTGFYSREVIQKMMKDNLKAKNPEELERGLVKAENIARKEAEGYTYLDAKMTVGGVSTRKMSEASKKKYLDYYKTTEFDEREMLVTHWKTIVEYEAKLTTDLAEIYKDNPEGLKLALGSFEELDFQQKQKAIEDHKRLVAKNQEKKEQEKELLIKAAEAKIDAAARKKIISQGGDDSTQGRYKEFFNNEENFKNPHTKAVGDLDEMKRAYSILVSPTPEEKYKNLAAYELRRTNFTKQLQKLWDIDPDLDETTLEEWQEKYDSETWTGREKIAKDELPKFMSELAAEQRNKKAIEAKAGIDKGDKKESKDSSPELAETISAVTKCFENKQGAQAMQLLLDYDKTDPDNPEIIKWIKVVAQFIGEFGMGKETEEKQEDAIQDELEDIIASDSTVQDDLEEKQIETLNIEGARQSEYRHDKNVSAHERARQESLDQVEGGSLEEDLVEDAYKHMGKTYILNEEGSGEEVKEVDFSDIDTTEEERMELKRKTYEEQSKLYKKEGFSHATLRDKSGQDLSAKEAETLQARQLDEFEKDLAAEALENLSDREVGEKGAKVFDLNSKIAAQRQAKQLVDQKRHEKLKQAA